MGYEPVAVFERFFVLARSGQDASSLAREALASCPLDHRLRWALAEHLLALGRTDEARAEYERLASWVTTSRSLRDRLSELEGALPGPAPSSPPDPLALASLEVEERELAVARDRSPENLLLLARALTRRAPLWLGRLGPRERASELGTRDEGMAARTWEEALTLRPGLPEAAAHLAGRVLSDPCGSPLGEDDADVRAASEGRYGAAVRQLERAAAARPPCAAALVVAAKQREAAGRPEALREAVRAEPDYLPALVALAEVAEGREAEEALRQAVGVAPHDPSVRIALGRFHARHGDAREAAAHLLWACALGEVLHDDLRKEAVSALLAQGLVDEASRACGFGRWFDTPDQLTVGVSARPSKRGRAPAPPGWPGVPEPPSEPRTASERRAEAMRLYARGATTRATELFREALALDPGDSVAGSHLALFEQHRGRWRTGISLAERVLATNRDAAEVWLVLAGLRRQGGDRAGEREALEEACQRDLPEAFRDLSGWLHEDGDVLGALEMQRRAVAARPKDPWLLETLADRLAEAGRRSEAVTARVDALVTSPRFLDEPLRAELASLPARSSEEEELARALDAPDEEERLERLARLFLARGREADARRLLERLHPWGRASALALLFDLQVRAGDREGLLESTARVIAGGGPMTAVATKLRRAALLSSGP